jgi:hypothetical protein
MHETNEGDLSLKDERIKGVWGMKTEGREILVLPVVRGVNFNSAGQKYSLAEKQSEARLT